MNRRIYNLGLLSSVQFSCSVMSDSLRPHELQHARLPCPSPTPGVYTNSCPLSRWCHLTISSLSSPSPPSFDVPNIRIFSNESALCIRWPKHCSFSFNISPSNQHPGLISFRMAGWIFLQSKGLSRVFYKTTVQKHQLLAPSFLFSPTVISIHDYWKSHSLN